MSEKYEELEAPQSPEGPPHLRYAGRAARPAILTIAALFVTCPSCSNDITLNTPDGESDDWSLPHLIDFDGETDPSELPKCPECGQLVTISLPKALPVNP